MSDYSLELARETARLKCSCCSAGMTSVCGFIRRLERPYSVYYALLHNTRKDIFVRLSISVGDWWRHDSYEHRYALCIDVTPDGENWRLQVREPIDSPQQTFAKFGEWLTPQAGPNDPRVQEIVGVANFIITHDPAVLSCLAGRRPDFSGREVQHITEN